MPGILGGMGVQGTGLFDQRSINPNKDAALCGSWLACDAGHSVNQANRGDAIAGKPGSHRKQLFEYDQAIGQFVAGVSNGHMHLEQLATGFNAGDEPGQRLPLFHLLGKRLDNSVPIAVIQAL